MTTELAIQTQSIIERLTPETVRKQLVRGNGDITEQEITFFVGLCQARNLNPFANEAYLIKYGSAPASTIVAASVFDQRAEINPAYNGKDFGVIVLKDDLRITPIYRKGSSVFPGEKLFGAWCEVHIKEREKPEYAEVMLSEYSTGKSMWRDAADGGKPATMICKVAKVHALRAAFPNDFSGCYTSDEINVSGDTSDTIEVEYEVVEPVKPDILQPLRDAVAAAKARGHAVKVVSKFVTDGFSKGFAELSEDEITSAISLIEVNYPAKEPTGEK